MEDWRPINVLVVMERDASYASRNRASWLDKESECARAAVANLIEATRAAIDLAWIPDSRTVEFDESVRFGANYDFEGLDESSLREEFHGQYECIVWPGRKWSAYCTYEGTMWFEKFETSEEAKETCMRLLDKALPKHPAMKARAALARVEGK